jgi:hypothetical protein
MARIIMGIINPTPMSIELDPIAPCNDECKLKLNFGSKLQNIMKQKDHYRGKWKCCINHSTSIALCGMDHLK